MNYELSLLEAGRNAVKKIKRIGIIAALALMLLGVCMFIRPLTADAVILWMLVIGLLIDGIEEIIWYFQMPKGLRNGFHLAAGILWIFASVLTIVRGCSAGSAETEILEISAAIMIGCTCIFSGIMQICSCDFVRLLGGSVAMCILGGILEVICGILVISSPITGLVSFTIAYGIYFLIVGIALLISILSVKVPEITVEKAAADNAAAEESGADDTSVN